ncbi:hypothetical protein ACGFZ9_44110 [Streptomyces mirabilis]|uniref:hypothetical protein n=1 Tax=Streptomyces mirabilis TaxID=68239 RepID=UPI0037126638
MVDAAVEGGCQFPVALSLLRGVLDAVYADQNSGQGAAGDGGADAFVAVIGDLRWDAEVAVAPGVRGDELPHVAVADQDR